MVTFLLKAFRDFKVRADAYKAEHGSYFANFERTPVDLERDKHQQGDDYYEFDSHNPSRRGGAHIE
ncbi:MAG: hypothetical protein ABL931_08895 [Usitatibacteraceae bacterium]